MGTPSAESEVRSAKLVRSAKSDGVRSPKCGVSSKCESVQVQKQPSAKSVRRMRCTDARSEDWTRRGYPSTSLFLAEILSASGTLRSVESRLRSASRTRESRFRVIATGVFAFFTSASTTL